MIALFLSIQMEVNKRSIPFLFTLITKHQKTNLSMSLSESTVHQSTILLLLVRHIVVIIKSIRVLIRASIVLWLVVELLEKAHLIMYMMYLIVIRNNLLISLCSESELVLTKENNFLHELWMWWNLFCFIKLAKMLSVEKQSSRYCCSHNNIILCLPANASF